MDLVLSDFIAKTSCEPGFARDLLNHHNWNLSQSLLSYYNMKDISSTNRKITTIDEELATKAALPTSTNSPASSPVHDNRLIVSVNENTSEALKDSVANLVSSKFNSEPSLSSQSSDVGDSKLRAPSKLESNGLHNDTLMFNEKKLTRGISRASNNVNLVSRARYEFAQDFQTSSRGSRLLNVDGFLETPEFTFSLPDISIHEEEFREFLRKDLIEKSTLNSLQSAKRLNWWAEVCQPLYPLVTSGDGNCLLHAASLGMWGFHDRELTLRRALYILLSNSSYTRSFYRRWRWHTHFQNSKAGLTYSETEWESEWENILRMASTEPRSKGETSNENLVDINGGKKAPNDYEEKLYTYESLEEIHIFALAHVLRRPIVVIADTMLKDSRGEAFFPIPFGGLYLPFECPSSCLMKSPLCLTYDAAHFSALVAMNSMDKSKPELPLAIPLMDVDHKILPLHFAIDPGEDIFDQKTTQPAVEKLLDSLAKTFVLTEQDKIELLKKYFDTITLSHFKEKPADVTNSPSNSAKPVVVDTGLKVPAVSVEKAQTLPSNFGRKPVAEFNSTSSDSSSASKTLARKSSYLLQRPFLTFGRMSKRIKKNFGNLARKSASFRLTKGKDDEKKSKDKQETFKEKSETEVVLEPLQVVLDVVDGVEEDKLNDSKTSIINTDNSIFYCETYVVAARLQKDKRPFYYDDMIKNYLVTARARFLNEKRLAKAKLEMMPSTSNTTISSVSSSSSTLSSSSSSSSSLDSKTETPATMIETNDGRLSCVSPNCSSPSSVTTNYLCNKCYEEQRKQMASFGSDKAVKTTTSAETKTVTAGKGEDEEKTVGDNDLSSSNSSNSSNVQSSYKHVNGNNKTLMDNYDNNGYDEKLGEKMKQFNAFNDPLSRQFFVPNSL